MNRYRTEYINILLKKQKRMRKDIKDLLGISNNSILKEIIDGRDIHISRLIKIADFFGVSCAEFFEFNGHVVGDDTPMPSSDALTQHLVRQIVDSEMAARKAVRESDEQLRKMEVESLQRLHQQQLEYEREMSRLREELVRTKAQLELLRNNNSIKQTQSAPYSLVAEAPKLQAAEDHNT